MSCTVITVPLALQWIVGAVAAAASAASIAAKNVEDSQSNDLIFENSNCEDVHRITTEHFMEKNFETPFVDKAILLKTLQEHGVKNIEDNDNIISGTIDNYSLTFSRKGDNNPFSVRISNAQGENLDDKIGDLNNEYAMNVQEDTYLHIIQKLKDNNMQIEEEVVEDDNTIVLTVNIE